jgi:hypothetical protein
MVAVTATGCVSATNIVTKRTQQAVITTLLVLEQLHSLCPQSSAEKLNDA